MTNEEIEEKAMAYLSSWEYRYMSPNSPEYWEFVEGAVWAYRALVEKEQPNA